MEANQICYEFLWGSKWERIKRNTLIAPLGEGGVNMIDIESFFIGLKLRWVKFLVNDEFDASSLSVDVEYIEDADAQLKLLDLRSNQVLQDVFQQNSILEFYSRLEKENYPVLLRNSKLCTTALCYWHIFKSKVVTDVSHLHEPLWFNKKISSKGKMLYIEDWNRKSICFIEDICDSKHQIAMFPIIFHHYCFSDFYNDMQSYLKVLSCIPQAWKNNLVKTPQANPHLSLLEDIRRNDKTSRYIYDKLRNVKILMPKEKIEKWSNELCKNLDNWLTQYEKVFYCTIESRLRSFHVKFALRAVPTNDLLFRINKTSSPKCTFCERNVETVLHLFYFCEFVQQFWEIVNAWLTVEYGLNLNLTYREILMGVEQNQGINCVLLSARYYIYKCKLRNERPQFDQFLYMIKSIFNCEKIIATRKCKLLNHIKKWKVIMNSFF
uniref:uncharacterized protein LOC120325769 n=1 Tax=Styela clava TaxID=7725 RepID=UPI001939F107|nr:uncharacterized protein LOC120325769 [Styela clava]